MPTLKQMMDEEGYVLSRIDCGLPSQTSACQAGIMFGDNDDIPAFRWYDKDEQKLFVSGKDADGDQRPLCQGQRPDARRVEHQQHAERRCREIALDAGRSSRPARRTRRSAGREDIYLLALNPYFLMRIIVLFLGDAMLEIWQGWQAAAQDVEPRLDRLHKFYPFVRAATTVFMRDVSSYLMTLDIVRGAPSIYVTWPGYDEVAHHSGPWTSDAFRVLHEIRSRDCAAFNDIIERKAPRPYDLIILSDHGQSFGAHVQAALRLSR